MYKRNGIVLGAVILLFGLQTLATAETNEIVAGQTVSSSLSGSATDIYLYTSPGLEWITISAARTGGGGSFDSVFDLVTPNGAVVVTSQSFVRSVYLTNAGLYRIISRDSDSFDGGTYNLTLISEVDPIVRTTRRVF